MELVNEAYRVKDDLYGDALGRERPALRNSDRAPRSSSPSHRT